jgi:hypothetical protein
MSHLGYRTALTDTILKGGHLRIISAKFGWNWLSSFRGEDFFLISSPLFFNFIIGQTNGQNCSILSQKVPKFELYKHNNELFNIYYGIFKELWTFTDFNRLCKLEKRGDEIKKKSSLKLSSQSKCSKFIKNPVIYVKKLIIMLIQFKFGHFLA